MTGKKLNLDRIIDKYSATPSTAEAVNIKKRAAEEQQAWEAQLERFRKAWNLRAEAEEVKK